MCGRGMYLDKVDLPRCLTKTCRLCTWAVGLDIGWKGRDQNVREYGRQFRDEDKIWSALGFPHSSLMTVPDQGILYSDCSYLILTLSPR